MAFKPLPNQAEYISNVEKEKVRWFQTCLKTIKPGLNIVASLHNKFTDPEPHILVTKEWQPSGDSGAMSRTGLMTMPTWIGPGFYYEWRGPSPHLDTQDRKQFCDTTPGFRPGIYYVGIFTKCLDAQPFFFPLPYPDLTKKASACQPTVFKLQLSTTNTACVVPILHAVPVSSIVSEGSYAWFKFNASDICQDIAIRVISVFGEPEIFVSNQEFPPNSLSYTWHSKSRGNEFLTISRSDANARPGFYYIAVLCEMLKPCPSSFTIEVDTYYPTPLTHSETSYTNQRGKFRWYQVCVRTALEAVRINANPRTGKDGSMVVSQFPGPTFYNDRWDGPAWREPFADASKGSSLPYQYIVAANHSGFTTGLYHVGIDFHKVSGRHTASTVHRVVNTFQIQWLVAPAPKFVPYAMVDKGQFYGIFDPVVYGVYFESPCPEHSTENEFIDRNPPFGSLKTCRCESGYYGLQPGQEGYNPELPACKIYEPPKFYRCEMWKNCYSPFFCGLYSENMCQPTRGLVRNVTSLEIVFLKTITYGYDYYQYNLTSFCNDLIVTVNASSGIPSVLVSTTGDITPLDDVTRGWVSNTYGEKVKQVRISHRDYSFDATVFYIAVSCYRCGYLKYTISVTEIPVPQSVDIDFNVTEDTVVWTPVCVENEESGLRVKAKGPYAALTDKVCPGPDCNAPKLPCMDDPSGKVKAQGTTCSDLKTNNAGDCSKLVFNTLLKDLCPLSCGVCQPWDCMDERLHGLGGSGYYGCQTKTLTGQTCMPWTSQFHAHVYTPENFPGSNLGAPVGYCRNPGIGEATLMIWCYTTNPKVRWDYCAPIHIEQNSPLLYLTKGRPGPSKYHALFTMSSWQSKDTFFNLEQPGIGKVSVSPPGTAQMELGRGIPGFKRGAYYIGVYIPCEPHCAGRAVQVHLQATFSELPLVNLYKDGLFIEFVQLCAINPSNQGVGNHKCQLNENKMAAGLQAFGIDQRSVVDSVIKLLDTNHDKFVSWYEFLNQRMPVLKQMSGYALTLPTTSMMGLPPATTWQNGEVRSGQYMYYEKSLGKCEELCVHVSSVYGQAELYMSPPPEQKPTVESSVWFSRYVQFNSICVGPETPGYEPGTYRIAVHCQVGSVCPAKFLIRFSVTHVEKVFVEVKAARFTNSNEIHWYKTCNAQLPVTWTIYPTVWPNVASKGDELCDYPFIYQGQVHTKCLLAGMPYEWCYHSDGTWGQCANGVLRNPLTESRPDMVANLESNTIVTGSMAGLGSVRIFVAKFNHSLPKTRDDALKIAAGRPSSYSPHQRITMPVEEHPNSGMLYWGVYAACAACAGSYNLTIGKVLNIKSSQPEEIIQPTFVPLDSTYPPAGSLVQSNETNAKSLMNESTYLVLTFNSFCKDLVIDIAAGNNQPMVPHLFASTDKLNTKITHCTFATDRPVGSPANPAWVSQYKQESKHYRRLWISHESPNFVPGYWYIGVHCLDPNSAAPASCTSNFQIKIYEAMSGNYPTELLLGEPLQSVGFTARGTDPSPVSVCVEVADLGITFSTKWMTKFNATAHAAALAAHNGPDPFKPVPDPSSTPLFAISKWSQAFRHISSAADVPVFMSKHFQRGGLNAENGLNDTLTTCSQLGWQAGIWFIGVFPYCLKYTRYTEFLPYDGFSLKVKCLPWYKDGEKNSGLKYSLETTVVAPECMSNCSSDVTYTRTTGTERHGICFGCRGTCICEKFWFGEACAAADCQYDNCLGHGICSNDETKVLKGYEPNDCICDPGFTGKHCGDVKEEICPSDCYGQGFCQNGWLNEPSNITVGSCDCYTIFEGHLCSYVPDNKHEDSSIPTNILIATVFAVLALLLALRVIKVNKALDAKERYEMVRHANPMFDGEDIKKPLDDQEGSDESSFSSGEEEGMWPDDKDWRPKDRRVLRNDGKVGDGDDGVRMNKELLIRGEGDKINEQQKEQA